jgi:hypothetical protein
MGFEQEVYCLVIGHRSLRTVAENVPDGALVQIDAGLLGEPSTPGKAGRSGLVYTSLDVRASAARLFSKDMLLQDQVVGFD